MSIKSNAKAGAPAPSYPLLKECIRIQSTLHQCIILMNSDTHGTIVWAPSGSQAKVGDYIKGIPAEHLVRWFGQITLEEGG